MSGLRSEGTLSGLTLEELKIWFGEYMSLYDRSLQTMQLDNRVTPSLVSQELIPALVEERIQRSTSSVKVTQGYCYQCQALLDDWPTPSEIINCGWLGPVKRAVVRPCSSFELEASARLGCRLCSLLYQHLKDMHRLDWTRKIEFRLEDLDEPLSCSVSIESLRNPTALDSGIDEGDAHRLHLNYPGRICADFPDVYIGSPNRYTSIQTRIKCDARDWVEPSADVFDIIKAWLVRCTSNHTHCHKGRVLYVPTRLLSIAGDMISLEITEKWNLRPAYATLSHAWGHGMTFKLKVDNYESCIKGIPKTELPKTILDAIVIARALGLEYLWIDSLCIIQNDPDDWEKECALMSKVYSGSTINIAAASAPDGTFGCFMKDNSFRQGLEAQAMSGSRSYIREMKLSGAYEMSTDATFLSTRAWALQERLLAKRTIHFGERGAAWECKELVAYECLPDGCVPLGNHENFVWGHRTHLRDHWAGISERYAAANLTYGKDKLPALAGIARKCYDETPDEYLAGLWANEIEHQLCWRPLSPRKRPAWRAPSWSWAALDGPFQNVIFSQLHWNSDPPRRKGQVHAHVIQSHLVPSGHDVFGQLSSGYITVACSTLLPGCFRQGRQVENSYLIDIALEAHGPDLETHMCQCHGDCTDDDIEFGSKIFLLPLVTTEPHVNIFGVDELYPDDKPKSTRQEIEWRTIGLLLAPAGNVPGRFRRLGSFKSTFWADKEVKNITRLAVRTGLNIWTAAKKIGDGPAKAACASIIENPAVPAERFAIEII